VVVIGIAVSGVREFNIRGPKLWLGEVPTADLSISLEGKKAIVTGANTGIGLEIAKALAAMGADVVLACRSEKKAQNAIDTIKTDVKELALQHHHNPGSLSFIKLDLSSFSSIRSFVKTVKERSGEGAAVDILVNNAGLISDNTRVTEEGFRDMIGVNYFGPFLLTHLLLPDLLLSAQNNDDNSARIVNVASNSHKSGVWDFEDIDHSAVDGQMNWHYIYGTSKAGNVLFTQSLAERVKGSGLIVTTNHPGVIKTDIIRSFDGVFYDIGVAIVMDPIAMTPWQGAQNTLFLATSPEAKSGEYYDRFDVEPPTWAFNNVDEIREKLWDYSCERVGVKNFDSWKELQEEKLQ